MSIIFPTQLPENPNYVEFVYVEKYFLPHEVDSIIRMWKEETKMDGDLTSGIENTKGDDLRQSDLNWLVPNHDNAWIFRKLGDLATQINYERYGYDLYGFQEELQLARYSEGHFFDWHGDFGPAGASNRKLSVSVQLTDPDEYEGGDLEFMINTKKVKAQRGLGTVIIFPSFVMHRVTPITKGARHSLVGWVSGPPFR